MFSIYNYNIFSNDRACLLYKKKQASILFKIYIPFRVLLFEVPHSNKTGSERKVTASVGKHFRTRKGHADDSGIIGAVEVITGSVSNR